MGLLNLAGALTFGVFITGSGDLSPDRSSIDAMTSDEKAYVTHAMEEHDNCEIRDCETKVASVILEVVNLRRQLDREQDSYLFNALRAPCEALIGNSAAQRDCFRLKVGLSEVDAMHAIGIKRQGMTKIGFYSLRTGMREKEVSFILGRSPETVAYSGYGGSSAEVIRYTAGRGHIIVTLTDGKVTGYAQAGL